MKNPVERRVERISQHWCEFRENKEARILRWLVATEGTRLVDVFLELQNEEVSEIPDLFVRFTPPFDDADQYGFGLRDFLLEEYESIQQDIADDEEVPSDWKCPSPVESRDIETFVTCCDSFRQYYDELMDHLVVVLQPTEVSDEDAWRRWLSGLLRYDVPEEVRFLIVEETHAASLDQIAAASQGRMVTQKLPLAVPAMHMELLRQVPGSGPGFAFQRHFMTLSNAAGSGNVSAARHSADCALRIATQQNWTSLQTVIHMLLGAAYTVQGDGKQVLAAFRQAQKAVAGKDDETSKKLLVQGRLSEAAALIEQEQWEEAADVYTDTAPLAKEVDDQFAHLECWRMAAYCHEARRQYDQSWQCGNEALKLGEAADQPSREESTLSDAAKGMLRVSKQPEFKDERQLLEEKLDNLFGADWKQKLEPENMPS